MFERFTQPARDVVVQAQEEARRLGHDHIGTEHLLLALLARPETTGGRALTSMGVQAAAVRAAITARVPSAGESPSGHIPFTPRAKKVLELSLREALALGDNHIGTEHIVLGLVREGEGLAAQVLVAEGVQLAALRESARHARAAATEDRPAPATGRTPAAEQALEAARQLAASAPMGTHHLLEALARVEDGAAAKVLAALGVDAEAIAAKIDELGTEGTADTTPEMLALQAMEIRVVDDEVHVVLRDPATLDLARRATQQLGGPVRGDDPVAGSLASIWHVSRNTLQQVVQRLSPTPEEGRAPRSLPGLPAAVQRAVQSRLRRLRQPPPGS